MTESTRGPIISLLADGIEIPPGILDLERFRAWARSDDFPERGRIDWVAGRLEVDMSPGDLNTHGSPKSAIYPGCRSFGGTRHPGPPVRNG